MRVTRENLIRNESVAKEFLTGAGVLRAVQPCTLCGSTRVVSASRGRSRCSDCGFTWGLRRGSIIENTHITYLQFIRMIRMFADDIPPDDAVAQLHMERAMVNRIYRRIRLAIIDGPAVPGPGLSIAGNILQHPTASRLDPVVFGIRIHAEVIEIERYETPFPDIIIQMEIPWSIRSNILFLDVCEKQYHGLIAYYPDRCNQETVIHTPKNRGTWPPLTVFWRFAQTLWSRHRYLERAQIPDFVQELAFRYNHRHRDMFHAIIETISQYDYSDRQVAGERKDTVLSMATGAEES